MALNIGNHGKLTLPFLLAIQVILFLVFNVHCSYNDEETLNDVTVSREAAASIARAYAHFHQMLQRYPEEYAEILFKTFPDEFEEAFGDTRNGANSQLLTMLNDFRFLPNAYMVTRRGQPFEALRYRYIIAGGNRGVLNYQIPRPFENDRVYVPRVFRAILGSSFGTNDIIGIISFRGVIHTFINVYVEHYPLNNTRTRAFTNIR